MKNILVITASIFIAATLLTACTNNEMGTSGGAALGGIAGYGLAGGSAVGTAVGAVGGGLVGHAVTR